MAIIVVGNNSLDPKNTQTYHAPDGITLTEWVRDTGLKNVPRLCFANGLNEDNLLLKSEQDKFRLKETDTVTMVPVPLNGGGGGSNPLKVLVAVALIAFAGPVAGFAAGATGVAVTAAAVAKFGAAMLLSAFVQPKPVSAPGSALDIKEASPTYAVQAQGNLARLNAAIPKLYGKHLVYPYFIAAPWTEYVSGKQYLTMIFLIGHGKYATEAPRMEDSPLTSFSRVSWAYIWYDSFGVAQYGNVYDGLGDNGHTNPRMHRVVTSGEVSGQVLLGNNEPGYDWVGPFVVNRSGTEIDSLQVDMIAPRGLYYANNDGSFASKTVQWEFQAQAVTGDGSGTGSWLPLTVPQTLTGSSACTQFIPQPDGFSEEPYPIMTVTLDTGVKGTSNVTYDASYSQGGQSTPNWYGSEGGGAELISWSVNNSGGNDIITAQVRPLWQWYGWGETNQLIWAGGVRFTFDYSYTSTTPTPSLTAATNEPQVLTYSATLPPGRWQVRGRRLDAKDTSARAGHELRWAGLKGALTQVPKYRDVTLLYVRIEASDKVSAQSSRKVNCVCTSILPVYRPSLGGWVEQTTRNPYWVMADILKARYGANLPNDSYLDLDGLADLAAGADTRGDTFDYYADQRSTVFDALTLVGRTCRTVPSRVAGKVYFVRDQPRLAPSALVSDNQIRPGTFQVERMMPGSRASSWIEAEYFDSSIWDWRKVMVGTAPPDPAALPLQIRLDGCSTEQQATREATYMSRVNRYRRTFVTFETEMDAALMTYGDLILVSHLLPDWAQTTSVVAYYGLTITLANQIDWGEAGTDELLLTFRLRNGKPSQTYYARKGSAPNIAIIQAGTLPTEGLFLYGVDAEPTTVLLGHPTRWAASCLVTQIRPRGLEAYSVTAVVDTGESYDDRPWVPSLPLGAGTYTVPDGVYKIEVTAQGSVKGEPAYWVRYGPGTYPPYDTACWLENIPSWDGGDSTETFFDVSPAQYALPVAYDDYHIMKIREGFTQVYDVVPGQQIPYQVGVGGKGEALPPIPGACLTDSVTQYARRGRDGEDGWLRIRILP